MTPSRPPIEAPRAPLRPKARPPGPGSRRPHLPPAVQAPLKLLATPLPAVALVPTEELEQMTPLIERTRRPSLPGAYLAVLIAALVVVAVGFWLATDNNTGTNSLATDEKAMTRTP